MESPVIAITPRSTHIKIQFYLFSNFFSIDYFLSHLVNSNHVYIYKLFNFYFFFRNGYQYGFVGKYQKIKFP